MASSPRTALILVDVINGFFEPGQLNYYEGVEAVIEPMRALLAAARASDSIVVHAAEHHRPGFADFEWKKLPVHHMAEAHDAAFFGEFRPEGAPKPSYSSAATARSSPPTSRCSCTSRGVGRVVIAGVKTNVCIRATAQDAFANGFEPIVPREATNSNRPHLAEASLEDIDRYFGRVVPLDRSHRDAGMSRIAITGYASLDHVAILDGVPAPGVTTTIIERPADAWPRLGGSPAYVASALVAAGLEDVVPISWVGPDEAGAEYCRRLQQQRVRCDGIETLPGTQTPVTILGYEPAGGCICLYDPGAQHDPVLSDRQSSCWPRPTGPA